MRKYELSFDSKISTSLQKSWKYRTGLLQDLLNLTKLSEEWNLSGEKGMNDLEKDKFRTLWDSILRFMDFQPRE